MGISEVLNLLMYEELKFSYVELFLSNVEIKKGYETEVDHHIRCQYNDATIDNTK